MKSIIIYYSYSGNTKNVANILKEYLLKEYLSQISEVEVLELKPTDESNNFFIQGKRAFKKIRANLGSVNLDLSAYDLICLGTPVWAFTTTPAMNACLDKCLGLENKQVVFFTTSGGAGDKKAFLYAKEILVKRGATDFKNFFVHHNKAKDSVFVLEKIKEIFS